MQRLNCMTVGMKKTTQTRMSRCTLRLEQQRLQWQRREFGSNHMIYKENEK